MGPPEHRGASVAIQDERLHRYLTEVIAPFSPYYKRLFAEHKVDRVAFKTVGDLRRLPFTSKADLLATSEEPEKFREFIITPDISVLKHPSTRCCRGVAARRSAVERRFEREYRPIFLTATTGRSSSPVAFTYTDYDMCNLRTAGARLIQTFAATTEDAGVNMFRMRRIWRSGRWCSRIGVWHVAGEFGRRQGDGHRRQHQCDREGQTRGAHRIPTFVYHVIREAHARGRKWPQVCRIVLGGEKTPQGIRRKMVSLLQEMGAGEVRVCSTYGFTEARLAWGECPTPPGEWSGYHLFTDLGVFEVVDPETGEVKGEGEPGELVYTPLDARGTVVLRYRTGITWMGESRGNRARTAGGRCRGSSARSGASPARRNFNLGSSKARSSISTRCSSFSTTRRR